MDKKPKISVIIPAYNEGTVIGEIIQKVRSVIYNLELDYEIIIVDDGSQDSTYEESKKAGAFVLSHKYNIGNGAAVKTGIRNATGESIILMDGDGQHNPDDIPRLLAQLDGYDMVVGARTSESVTGLHRDVANKLYNWLASYVCGREIKDLTSGFRVIKTEVAQEFIYLLPNTFSYPTTITLACVRSGYSLKYLPIATNKRVGKSKINLFVDGSRFLLIIFKIATLFSPLKIFIPISVLIFVLGFGYGLFKVIFLGERYGPTSALLMTMSILIFLVGLVSEQISQLRYERTIYHTHINDQKK